MARGSAPGKTSNRNPGKFGKPHRGTGRHFTDISHEEFERQNQSHEESDTGSSDESEDSEEESSDEEGTPRPVPDVMPSSSNRFAAPPGAKLGQTANEPNEQIAAARATRRAGKKDGVSKVSFAKVDGNSVSEDDRDESEEIPDANLNRKMKNIKLSDVGNNQDGMSRKEREAAERKAAKERYQKLHQAGKTDEARADLARLAKIRKDREAAALRRKAEEDAKVQDLKSGTEKTAKKALKKPEGYDKRQ